MQCELKDSTGNAVKPWYGVYSDGRPRSCWLALPRDSSLRFSTTILVGSAPNSLVVSVGEALIGGAWKIPLTDTNDYYLSGTFASLSVTNETRPRVWEGTLKLPPVNISVKNLENSKSGSSN